MLNANYLASQLDDRYEMPFFNAAEKRFCAHEFIAVPKPLLDRGVTLIDMAKRMIDYSVHPPTMHCPVHDFLMIEPNETLDGETGHPERWHPIAGRDEPDATCVANTSRTTDATSLAEL